MAADGVVEGNEVRARGEVDVSDALAAVLGPGLRPVSSLLLDEARDLDGLVKEN
jgi:hypothetical protein